MWAKRYKLAETCYFGFQCTCTVINPARLRPQGCTLLHKALSWCFNDTGRYLTMFQLVVSYVKERGLDPNAINNHGQTATWPSTWARRVPSEAW